ncbi:MAG TPA: arsenite methyltransferase [Nitrososphaera sp.]|nr:arsenite methyltransferase [Nitrososphaera sp.]
MQKMNDAEIKDKVRIQYAKIALGESSSCCMPGQCCVSSSEAAQAVGYDSEDLKSIPEASVLGAGCGAPLNFADINKGETVVDLGAGAGIDVFLSANRVGNEGKVIGIDMTDEMIQRARKNANENGYTNVEFRKGDIEQEIPVEDNSVDLVISNCVVNLTSSKGKAFRQIHRILKSGGRMVISDLVTDREIESEQVDAARWCSCIDGALTREHYIESIKSAGFENVEVLQEQLYKEGDQVDGRKVTSLVIRAVK